MENTAKTTIPTAERRTSANKRRAQQRSAFTLERTYSPNTEAQVYALGILLGLPVIAPSSLYLTMQIRKAVHHEAA